MAVAVDTAHRPGGRGLAAGVRVVRHLAGRSRDLARLDVAAWAYGLLAVLELVVILRYTGTVRWSTPAIWVYLGLATWILATSAYALLRLHRRPLQEPVESGDQAAVP